MFTNKPFQIQESSTHDTKKRLSQTTNEELVDSVADPRGAWGACAPPFLEFLLFFYKQKITIKRVRNLSQNTGNGHFRDSNFQKFLAEHCPQTPLPNNFLCNIYFKLKLCGVIASCTHIASSEITRCTCIMEFNICCGPLKSVERSHVYNTKPFETEYLV